MRIRGTSTLADSGTGAHLLAHCVQAMGRLQGEGMTMFIRATAAGGDS